MSADQIKDLENDLKNGNVNKYHNDNSDEDSDEDNNSSSKSNPKGKNAIDMLKALIELRNDNNKHGKELGKSVSETINAFAKKNLEMPNSDKKTSDKQSSKQQNKQSNKQSSKQSSKQTGKQTGKQNEESEPDNDSEDESVNEEKSPPKQPSKTTKPKPKQKEESEDESEEPEIKSPPKQQKPVRKIQKQPQIKTVSKIIEVDCSEFTDEPEHYNDYLIEFDELVNVTDIKLDNFSALLNELSDTSNTLTIKCDGKEYDLEFDSGYYTVGELLEQINENFEEIGCGIVSKVKSGKVIFERSDRENFEIVCEENTIAKHLGFTENSYSGKYKYIAEQSHAFIENPFYMYLKNISSTEPFATINPDGSFEQHKIISNTIPELNDGLICQFKTEISPNDDKLINFGGIKHDFTLEITMLDTKTNSVSKSR
jgi:hypothetical protein